MELIKFNDALTVTEEDVKKIEEALLGNAMQIRHSSIDRIIEDAFQGHFGFPLKDVQDKEELERISIEGDPIVSFRYRGETFLYVQEGGLEYDIDKTGDGFEVTIKTKYINV